MWLALLVFIEICLMGGVVTPYSRHSLFSQKGDFLSLLNTFNAARKPPPNRRPNVIGLVTDKFHQYELEELPSCDHATQSGVYSILLPCFERRIAMRCETGFDQKNGNWMVIQRRVKGEVNFYRNWEDYKYGFGTLENEFFYGLRYIHNITYNEPMQLGIVLKSKNGRKGYAIYRHFEVGNETTNYQLIDLGSMIGNIGDGLKYHYGQPFSTFDRKNDGHDDENCALSYRGGWWYRKCYQSNLNGVYPFDREDCAHCARWNTFHKKVPLEFTLMAVRKRREITLEEPPWNIRQKECDHA